MSECVKATKIGQLFEERSNVKIGGRTLELLNKVKKDPENADLWHMYGWSLMSDHRLYKEAVAAVSKAVSLNPFKFEYWVSKGWIFLKLHRFEDACAAYTVAEHIDPYSWIPLYHKAMARVYLEEYDEAIKIYERAITEKTFENKLKEAGNNLDWPSVLHWSWLTYMLMGQPKKAWDQMKRITLTDEFYWEHTPLNEKLCSDNYFVPCLMYKGYLEPIALLAMAEDKSDDVKADCYAYVGLYYEMTGEKEKAMEIYRKAAKCLGDNTSRVLPMVMCSRRLRILESEKL